jgi:pilus assembly protein TadC
MMSVLLSVLLFFLIDKTGRPLILVPAGFVVVFLAIFFTQIRSVDAKIHKRAREIDKDVLFAGRFLLVKLNSGRPLLNAIYDASQAYGVASSYFKEIVRDIELGTPLEKALEKGSRYCPSLKMRRILFQITNALKIGIDVTSFLEATLDEIADQQLIEIQRYGRKLNGITMFYMLLAIVVPSLGVTIAVAVASIISISIDFSSFMVVVFFLIIVQFVFLAMFKAMRPNVNI